jgi:(E)-4-hydroxy-3-methylbut-2-enyl-diphosphate synthase
MTLRGPNIAAEFKAIVEDYVARRYGQGRDEQHSEPAA